MDRSWQFKRRQLRGDIRCKYDFVILYDVNNIIWMGIRKRERISILINARNAHRRFFLRRVLRRIVNDSHCHVKRIPCKYEIAT